MNDLTLKQVIGFLGDRVKVGDTSQIHPSTADLGLYVDGLGHLLALTPEQVKHRAMLSGAKDPIGPADPPDQANPAYIEGPTGPIGSPYPHAPGLNGPPGPQPQMELFDPREYQQGAK